MMVRIFQTFLYSWYYLKVFFNDYQLLKIIIIQQIIPHMFSEIQLNLTKTLKKDSPLPQDIWNTNKQTKPSIIDKPKPKWEWYQCDFILNQQINGQSLFWSLQPNIVFTSPNDISKRLSIKIHINMEKQFDFGELEGWLWHKTWIIPSIVVNIEIEGQQGTQGFQFPANTYVEILAVKPGSKNPQKFYLMDVGLQGMEAQEAQVGKIIFQGMKFSETSYKHEGSKFNLVVALMYRAQGQAHPLVVDCKISPPIFIDSRRSAREDSQKKINKVFDTFTPDMFSKPLFKRKRQEEEIITNDCQGFLNYFTAPNIRNKIKNPFFLAYKFSNFISLFYNSHRIQKKKDLVTQCMNKFSQLQDRSESIRLKSKSKKTETDIDKVNPDAYLSLVFKNKQNQNIKTAKQILQKFGNYEVGLINILFDASFLPKKYILIADSQEIKMLYEQYFYLNNYYNSEGKDAIKKLQKQQQQKSISINNTAEPQLKQLIKHAEYKLKNEKIIQQNHIIQKQITKPDFETNINNLLNQQILMKQLQLNNLIKLNQINQGLLTSGYRVYQQPSQISLYQQILKLLGSQF